MHLHMFTSISTNKNNSSYNSIDQNFGHLNNIQKNKGQIVPDLWDAWSIFVSHSNIQGDSEFIINIWWAGRE